ncbi:MAG: DUF502 domain-containing protein [Chlamydiota bacterium]|nr:DUF502 domain-containing protein [Chlamydiota bacterium]
MKKYFITGLAILLPAVLTIVIFSFIINLLTKPFVGVLENTLEHYGLLDTPILFFSARQVVAFFSRVIILAILFIITVFIGLLTRIVIFHYLIRIGNYIIHRIPFINKIYKATQDVIGTIFKAKTATFSQVVLVPFPSKSTLCLGLITNDPQTDQPIEDSYGNVSVFVPATPNPTMGFMLLYKRHQMIDLEMSVEEALKFIVSCGVMSPGFKAKTCNTNLNEQSL